LREVSSRYWLNRGVAFATPRGRLTAERDAVPLSRASTTATACAVYGIDVPADWREPVRAALRASGLDMRWCNVPDTRHEAALACVHVDGGARGDAAIRGAAGRGAHVLAFASGCSAWPIGKRCHALIVGAQALLDSTEPEFLQRLAATLDQWRRELEARRDADQADACLRATLGIVGSSAAMLQAWSRLRRAAQLTDLPVLLLGETGSGKELMARAIHRLDERRHEAPWITVNCAAIAPALAEAELFGAERGAYTGAQRDRRGLLRAADHGTLFLDEVGELSEEVQAKLLRAIQEQCVLPVGAERELPIDVRIVAATHRDLASRVREGRFREDLYFRLAVLPIEVPPLRQRREDIDALITQLLRRAGERRDATPALREALRHCEWPGNVRELDATLRQAIVAAGDGTVIDLMHLPAALLRSLDGGDALPTPGRAASPTVEVAAPHATPLQALFDAADWKLGRVVERCERELIEAAFARSRGNQAAMARLLGVTPRCIYGKLRKHSVAALPSAELDPGSIVPE
jgi:transcriptional regulator with PAS, ATPase and Fis domain